MERHEPAHEFDRVPIPQLIWRLGVPAMAAQCFNILYTVVDRIFVGHMAMGGDLALASIGVCAPALTAVTGFASLIGVGGASVMSMAMGRGDREEMALALRNAFVLLIVISVMVTAVLLLFTRPLLYALGCSDAMYPYAEGYFTICALGTGAVLLGMGLNQFILAFGRARRGMAAVILGAVVNTVLDPICIYVLDMGIYGAAAATVIAQLCTLACVLSFLCSAASPVRLSPAPLDSTVVRRIFAIGSMPFAVMVLDNLLIIALNVAIRLHGGDLLGDRYLSGAAVVQSFMLLAFYPAQGITLGCATLYSYHYGARHYDKVRQVFLYVFLLCGGYMLLLTGAAQLVPELFARLFVEDAELIALSALFIRRYTLGLIGVAVQYAIVDGLTVMGEIRRALPVSLFRKLLYVVCVFLIPLVLPLEDIFYAQTISDLAGASVTALLFLTWILPGLRGRLS